MENSDAGLFALIAGVYAIILFIFIIVTLIRVISLWKIFDKADKPGWAALIPIYNTVILHEVVGKPGWWVLLYFIPGVGTVIWIWVTNLLSKSFGQSEGFTVGLVFLPVIFYPMLAFGDYQYQGPAAAEAQQ